MNKATITRLLNRKNSLTGEEIGKLVLYNTAYELKSLKETHKLKSIMTSEEMQGMINTISDEYNAKMFNCYLNLMNTIKFLYNTSMGYKYKALYFLSEFKGEYINFIKHRADLTIIANLKISELVSDAVEPSKTIKTFFYDLILDNSRYLYAYNTFIDMVIDFTGIKELEYYKQSVSEFEKNLQSVKNDLKTVYSYLDENISDAEAVKKIKEAIETTKPIIELSEIEPEEDIKKWAEKKIKDINTYTGLTPQSDILELLVIHMSELEKEAKKRGLAKNDK